MALAKHSTTPAIINRRQLFAAAPALAFLPSAVVAAPEMSPFDRVMHHARELYRALNETCPGKSASEYLCMVRTDGYFAAAGVGGCNFMETAGGWVKDSVRA